MDEVYKVLQKPYLEQLRAVDEDRAALVLSFGTNHPTPGSST
jgi:hypothetical protein